MKRQHEDTEETEGNEAEQSDKKLKTLSSESVEPQANPCVQETAPDRKEEEGSDPKADVGEDITSEVAEEVVEQEKVEGKLSELASEQDQEKESQHPGQEQVEGDDFEDAEDLDDEISAAVEKADEEGSESEEPETLDEKEAVEGASDNLQQMPPVIPLPAEPQHTAIPIPSPRALPVLSHTRVKCQDCASLISVCRRAGDNIVLLKCPVCCSYVAFDHLHSPTIIPYQERTDNFSCHTWNPTQLMVFLQQMGLGGILPYLAHHNIDGRAMMELFRGELRQRVGLQTEEQTQALLTALNILRLGEGIA